MSHNTTRPRVHLYPIQHLTISQLQEVHKISPWLRVSQVDKRITKSQPYKKELCEDAQSFTGDNSDVGSDPKWRNEMGGAVQHRQGKTPCISLNSGSKESDAGLLAKNDMVLSNPMEFGDSENLRSCPEASAGRSLTAKLDGYEDEAFKNTGVSDSDIPI